MREKKLSVKIADQIERRIVSGGWPVDTMIGSEAQLLKEFAVSRAVLREAILILEQRQIARRQRGIGGGVLVCAPAVSSVARTMALFLECNTVNADELLEARVLLEGYCAAKAARTASPDMVMELKAHVNAGLKMRGEKARVQMGQFHVLLAKMAGNPVWGLVTEALIGAASSLLQRHGRFPTDSEIHAQFRYLAKVVEAIERHDDEAAQEHVRKYIESVQRYYMDELPSAPQGKSESGD